MATGTRQEWQSLAAQLRGAGKPAAAIARELRERFGVGAVAALRVAHGWSQHDAASEWTARWPELPKTYKEISNWETGRHTPPLDIFDKLAELYACDLADLLADRKGYRDAADEDDEPDGATAGGSAARSVLSEDSHVRPRVPGTTGPGVEPEDEDVDRRSFVTGAVLAALHLPAPMRRLLGSTDGPVTIGQVDVVARYLDEFRDQDAAAGADGVLGVAMALYERVTLWLTEGSQRSEVRVALQAVRADLGAHVAWLAFDAGRSGFARHYLHDTIFDARLADNMASEVCAMSCMCLLLNRAGRPREALQCAEAAQRIAEPWATPRLRTLLHLRAAAAHAELGDPGAFGKELHMAETQLDRGQRDDDLPWTRFVTAQELVGLAGHSHGVMGRPDLAVSALQSIVEEPHPEYHRNTVLYTVLLARALAQNGDITQSAAVGLETLPAVRTLQSRRTRREMRLLRWTLDEHRDGSLVADEFVDAFDHA
jgi:transcriptional regulator with XRE-family HTH domain